MDPNSNQNNTSEPDAPHPAISAELADVALLTAPIAGALLNPDYFCLFCSSREHNTYDHLLFPDGVYAPFEDEEEDGNDDEDYGDQDPDGAAGQNDDQEHDQGGNQEGGSSDSQEPPTPPPEPDMEHQSSDSHHPQQLAGVGPDPSMLVPVTSFYTEDQIQTRLRGIGMDEAKDLAVRLQGVGMLETLRAALQM